jgi:hypothetical protein
LRLQALLLPIGPTKEADPTEVGFSFSRLSSPPSAGRMQEIGPIISKTKWKNETEKNTRKLGGGVSATQT